MRWLTCLVFVLAPLAAWGDDPEQTAPSLVQTRLDAATAAYERASTAVTDDYAKLSELPASAQATREREIDQRWDAAITPTIDALLDVAASHPADPCAVEGLGFVVLKGRGLTTREADRALVALRRDHVRASNISTVTRALFVHENRPEALALVRAVVTENPDRAERGRATADLAWMLVYYADRIDERRRSDRTNPPHLKDADTTAMRLEAGSLYDRCLADYADVPVVGYGAGKSVGEFAEGNLAGLRQLQVGKPAPEIVGADVEGKPLRLSDHRGRIVVLTFSGQWCGGCRANAPIFRDLLRPEAQRTNPCVVLEVNTDATREPLRAAIASGEITWPCWFDGGVTGPITMAWGNEVWPFLYVIDAEGIIRARNIAGSKVAEVVAEIARSQPPIPKP